MRNCFLAGIVLFSVALVAQGDPVAKLAKDGWIKTSDNIRLHYLEAGTGPAVLFVPGWTIPASIWQQQIDYFAKTYHVVAVDPRSQGDSDKPTEGNCFSRRAQDYRELVDSLKLKNIVFVGWSLGAEEGVYYAGHLADGNVRGYVLVDGFVWDKTPTQMLPGMLGWLNAMQEERESQSEKFVRGMYKKPQSEAYLKSMIEASRKMPTNSAVASVASTLGVQSWEPSLKKIDRPVYYAYTAATQPTADLLKKYLGDKVRIDLFADAGHALFVDDAERFNHSVDEWLKTLPQ